MNKKKFKKDFYELTTLENVIVSVTYNFDGELHRRCLYLSDFEKYFNERHKEKIHFEELFHD